MSSNQPRVARRAAICITAALLTLCACTREAPTDATTTAARSPLSSEKGTATLSWEPPRRNLDGSTIGNLAGYYIYYGQDPTNLNATIKITDPYVTTYTIDKLSPGTFYFRIVAFTDTGTKGSVSPTVSKTIR
jgi:hypothetical protein